MRRLAAGRRCWPLDIIPLHAADVTITVNGKVVAKPCTVSTANATVDLGDLYTFSLVSAGSASAWHSVALDLSNCPVGTSRVIATFSGTADSTGYYKNQGTAGNIQLELQDDSGTTLNNGAAKVGSGGRSHASPRASRCRSGRCRSTAAPPREPFRR